MYLDIQACLDFTDLSYVQHFDMDFLFGLLVDKDPKLSHPHNPFHDDVRHRRSFVFTLEFFTIVGESCKPMKWQLTEDRDMAKSSMHINLTRCSSVVALAFEGNPAYSVRNKDRRIQKKMGYTVSFDGALFSNDNNSTDPL